MLQGYRNSKIVVRVCGLGCTTLSSVPPLHTANRTQVDKRIEAMADNTPVLASSTGIYFRINVANCQLPFCEIKSALKTAACGAWSFPHKGGPCSAALIATQVLHATIQTCCS
jgi:hypothetical protein